MESIEIQFFDKNGELVAIITEVYDPKETTFSEVLREIADREEN